MASAFSWQTKSFGRQNQKPKRKGVTTMRTTYAINTRNHHPYSRHSNNTRIKPNPFKKSFLRVLLQSLATAIIMWLTGWAVMKILFYGTAEDYTSLLKIFFYCSIIVYPTAVLAEAFSRVKEYDSVEDFNNAARSINVKFIRFGTPTALFLAFLIRMLSHH